ncbi:MAG: type II toxin-antitoxin system VapC family toxin [Candidatus Latescibacteria bacterium]|nr:type II toxin-antitoxin system VapC family toxin [Candidatus Latescibacterota bacterium]
MSALVADTHAAIWYLSRSPKLSAPARAAMNRAEQSGEPVYVSSISLVEVAYLVEKGKLPETAFDRLRDALADPLSGFVLAPLDRAIALAVRQIPREAVPDMPDRIITATSLFLNLPLVTRDPQIQAARITTIW